MEGHRHKHELRVPQYISNRFHLCIYLYYQYNFQDNEIELVY